MDAMVKVTINRDMGEAFAGGPAQASMALSLLPLEINGEERSSASDPLTPLLDVLRDEFFLTGAKIVCREGFCGACVVLLDGRPVASCLVPLGLAAHCEVRTVESLAREGVLSPLQRAMEEHDAVQCGMCFPGMLMTLTGLFERKKNPTREDVKEALVGNMCRCTGYERIVDAALSVARAADVEGQ
jgi:aerobic carbon-monoxide dehydrogenase small subunit